MKWNPRSKPPTDGGETAASTKHGRSGDAALTVRQRKTRRRTRGNTPARRRANLMLAHTQTAPSDQHGNSAESNEHERRRLGNDVRLHLYIDRSDGGGKDWRRCQQSGHVLKSAGQRDIGVVRRRARARRPIAPMPNKLNEAGSGTGNVPWSWKPLMGPLKVPVIWPELLGMSPVYST